MDVGETRQICSRVERDRIITRLDDKYRHSVLDWQVVAAMRAGANDLAAVRNEDTPDAGIACLPLPCAGPRFEDGSLNDLWASAARRQWGGLRVSQHIPCWDGGDEGSCRGHQIAAREIGVKRHLLPLLPCPGLVGAPASISTRVSSSLRGSSCWPAPNRKVS